MSRKSRGELLDSQWGVRLGGLLDFYDFDICAFVDKAEEDEEDEHDDRNNYAPNQQLVSRALPSHFLVELLVGVLHVLGRAAKLLIDHFNLGALQFGLVTDVSSQFVDVLHDASNHIDRLVAILDQVCHLVGLCLLVDPATSSLKLVSFCDRTLYLLESRCQLLFLEFLLFVWSSVPGSIRFALIQLLLLVHRSGSQTLAFNFLFVLLLLHTLGEALDLIAELVGELLVFAR